LPYVYLESANLQDFEVLPRNIERIRKNDFWHLKRFLAFKKSSDKGVDLSEEGARVSLYLTQRDVRELQKAKAVIRAAIDILMNNLDLGAGDLQRMILTGSFGSQLNVEAVVGLGMIPVVGLEIVETSANGALFGRRRVCAGRADRGYGRTGGSGPGRRFQ